jgi:hypothetical protein
VSEMDLLDQIISHLGAAQVQRAASDDKLIAGHIDEALKAAKRLRPAIDLLEELEDHFDNEADVVDGDYGVPRPNEAMRWQQRIREAFGRGGF